MFSALTIRPSGARSVQAARGFRRKRKADYFRVPEGFLPKPDPKSHDGPLKRQLKVFLGPKNIRGEYYTNKYCYPPQNHQPLYIDENNFPRVTPGVEVFQRNPSRDLSKFPFPHNRHTQTAQVILEDMKQKIFSEVVEKGVHVQEVAHKYGIRLPRVEALVKLQHIERQWRSENKINEDLDKFSKVMNRMFPLFYPPRDKDNLTEIPTPAKTLHQRFLTISESEPFGPVDAGKIFGLEPAQETLNSLSEFKEVSDMPKVKQNEVVVGVQKQGDDTEFRFTKATAGEVGYRYGASRRDKKRDRAVGFDKLGRMVYTV